MTGQKPKSSRNRIGKSAKEAKKSKSRTGKSNRQLIFFL